MFHRPAAHRPEQRPRRIQPALPLPLPRPTNHRATLRRTRRRFRVGCSRCSATCLRQPSDAAGIPVLRWFRPDARLVGSAGQLSRPAGEHAWKTSDSGFWMVDVPVYIHHPPSDIFATLVGVAVELPPQPNVVPHTECADYLTFACARRRPIAPPTLRPPTTESTAPARRRRRSPTGCSSTTPC